MDPTAEYFLQRAEEYVRLSNEGELDVLFAMFEENATYVSSQVGSFEGSAEISAMMRTFFDRYPDANWNVPSYTFVAPDTVTFSFTMSGTDQDEQQKVTRSGEESISFSKRGLIKHIEVRVRS